VASSAQSRGGILRVSGTKLELLEPSIQARTSPISADREGNLWLGTNGEGLVRFSARWFIVDCNRKRSQPHGQWELPQLHHNRRTNQ
jgi:ligand-binding sensor domain-containing protein